MTYLVLAVFCFFNLKNNEPDINSQHYRFPKSWIFAIAISFIVLLIAIAFYNYRQADLLKAIVGNTIKQSIGAGITMFFLYAILYKIRPGDRSS